jgi:hypothetical protein
MWLTVTFAAILGAMAALKFMWNVRHAKPGEKCSTSLAISRVFIRLDVATN